MLNSHYNNPCDPYEQTDEFYKYFFLQIDAVAKIW